MKAPAGVIGVTYGIWSGRDFVLSRREGMSLRSHVEGRSRSGSLAWGTTALDGQLKYDGNGVDVKLVRALPSIRSTADVTYHFKNQAFSTRLSHQLAQHITVSVSATQPQMTYTEADARISYQLVF